MPDVVMAIALGWATLPRIEPGERRELYDRHEERARAHALEHLETLAEEMTSTSTTLTVLEGRPVEALQGIAAERQAALLVTGTVASQGLDFLMHGSVPARLAAVSSCPLVVAPPAAAVAEPGPVLVGDDDSDESRLAVRHTSALAPRLGREVMVVPRRPGNRRSGDRPHP